MRSTDQFHRRPILGVGIEDQGQYTCTAKNAFGQQDKTTALLVTGLGNHFWFWAYFRAASFVWYSYWRDRQRLEWTTTICSESSTRTCVTGRTNGWRWRNAAIMRCGTRHTETNTEMVQGWQTLADVRICHSLFSRFLHFRKIYIRFIDAWDVIQDTTWTVQLSGYNFRSSRAVVVYDCAKDVRMMREDIHVWRAAQLAMHHSALMSSLSVSDIVFGSI